VVRNLDDEIVHALKQRAAAQGKSAEELHRQLLHAALLAPKRRTFAEVISSMPNVGEDADFDRKLPRRQCTGKSTGTLTGYLDRRVCRAYSVF
jgi:plasmid stability protein